MTLFLRHVHRFPNAVTLTDRQEIGSLYWNPCRENSSEKIWPDVKPKAYSGIFTPLKSPKKFTEVILNRIKSPKLAITSQRPPKKLVSLLVNSYTKSSPSYLSLFGPAVTLGARLLGFVYIISISLNAIADTPIPATTSPQTKAVCSGYH